MKFHIWLFEQAIETPFNLGWSRPEADLRQGNPSLKHFGIAPGSESEHMEPSRYLSVKKKYGGLADIYIS